MLKSRCKWSKLEVCLRLRFLVHHHSLIRSIKRDSISSVCSLCYILPVCSRLVKCNWDLPIVRCWSLIVRTGGFSSFNLLWVRAKYKFMLNHTFESLSSQKSINVHFFSSKTAPFPACLTVTNKLNPIHYKGSLVQKWSFLYQMCFNCPPLLFNTKKKRSKQRAPLRFHGKSALLRLKT